MSKDTKDDPLVLPGDDVRALFHTDRKTHYRKNKRVDWRYYQALVAELERAGVDEDRLPLDFPFYHWTAKESWLCHFHPSIFLCPCCKHIGTQIPGFAKCASCAGIPVPTAS
jgi:hypothetical protein